MRIKNIIIKGIEINQKITAKTIKNIVKNRDERLDSPNSANKIDNDNSISNNAMLIRNLIFKDYSEKY